MTYKSEYDRWLANITDSGLLAELKSMTEAEAEDAFYCDMTFGTGGLRGVLGAGTNRMNIYTVAKASQGLADYLLKNYEAPSIAVSYDSRIKSDLFSKTASSVFAANGIKVHIYPELMPTPCLSFAVRALSCSAGIMVTASHNPAKYNGYKVYGSDGCQITESAAGEIFKEIDKLDIFTDIQTCGFDEALKNKMIQYVPEDIYIAYMKAIKEESVLFGDRADRDISIVYTPLNGTGLKPVVRALRESGFSNITIVSEQEKPDGNFPACPFPNPETKEAMKLGLEYCGRINADILLATDPDCDRCGIAVRSEDGYQLLSGNEAGLLLLDFICSQRLKHGKMPANPVFIKTIVTAGLAEKVAADYGVETVNVLTGFKFIGETVGRLEKNGREKDFICGFEESYGYLTGTYVRDKDAVNAAHMICEMAAYYHERGITLTEKLSEIYEKYGYSLDTLDSYEFPGSSGMQKMQEIMSFFRSGVDKIADEKVERFLDYQSGIGELPKSDVLQFFTKNASIVIRPSGTEPKLKIYSSVTARNKAAAQNIKRRLISSIERKIEQSE